MAIDPKRELDRKRTVAEHLKKDTERLGMSDSALKSSMLDHLLYSQGKDQHSAHKRDLYLAVALVTRDRLVRRWIETRQATFRADAKCVYYLSLEFLMGRALSNNLIALNLYDRTREMLTESGVELSDLLEKEPDAGLGNGGLGRLAACFLDSMATLGLPAIGYGIRYEFGIFDQVIRNGWQVEKPDQWLALGNPWELPNPEYQVPVKFYGRCAGRLDEIGRYRVDWIDTEDVVGVPHDTPVVGYQNDQVNTLRLWRARATNEFDLEVFNAGDYLRAVQHKEFSESISKVLYPDDSSPEGKELRLKQQYFFVACSLHDIVRRYRRLHDGFAEFPDKVAIQLNDTHPAIAVPELMRILIDGHGLEWDEAWSITTRTFAYTNHTLLPEALEVWPVSLLGRVLPRHLDIIFEINQRFMQTLDSQGVDGDRKRRMSIIDDDGEKRVRMAHLATVGSHKVNGVAALHTDLLKAHVLNDFHRLWPDKIVNCTNGVSPRRWLRQSNPRLSGLITEAIGEGWVSDLDRLRGLEKFADDAAFRARFCEIKLANKQDLAPLILRETGVRVDLGSMFDVQVKRIHLYKRQLLNVLRVVALYQELKQAPGAARVPRTVLIGGKAAPGYRAAKLVIKLVNAVAERVNGDRATAGLLRVAFLPNYRVSLAERIFPASDLSEQISAAGKEASGTGNMKFSMNGALTIGTLDGANVEIREAVGHENFFLFGLTAEQAAETQRNGYEPRRYYEENGRLKAALDAIAAGAFSPHDAHLFRPLVNDLLERDEYLLLADFGAYLEAQCAVEEVYRDPNRWARMAILNVARMGHFSSDRTVLEYAQNIWGARPLSLQAGKA